jgi:hypothetical protein
VGVIDSRLNEKEMKFLWNAISKKNKMNVNHVLAGNISKSENLIDNNNWFFESCLKVKCEKIFYSNWEEYYRFKILKEEKSPEWFLKSLWVNYQKQHEFNPPHYHQGGIGFSFVVFMKIPTHWKEQHALPFVGNANSPAASNFAFINPGQPPDRNISFFDIKLSSEDEGRMLFFPSSQYHQVYPFYGTEEERITISGNIQIKSSLIKSSAEVEDASPHIEELKTHIKVMEHNINLAKKRLKSVDYE